MTQATTFESRRGQWCRDTGARPSQARSTAALPWIGWPFHPAGFDHTSVYYWPAEKLHFILTEPYHSYAEAVSSVALLAVQKGRGFSCVAGPEGAGLWLPGACQPLLLAVEGRESSLMVLAAALPDREGRRVDTKPARLPTMPTCPGVLP